MVDAQQVVVVVEGMSPLQRAAAIVALVSGLSVIVVAVERLVRRLRRGR